MIPRLEWPAVLEGAKAVRNTNARQKREKKTKQRLLALYFITVSINRYVYVLDSQIGCLDTLPAEPPQSPTDDTEFLQKLHHVLLEIDVTEGHLECPETGRKFPILNGIPNMLLNEDEV